MPLTFLQECEDSAEIHQNPLEWDQNETGFHWNYCIPAGIELESAGMTLFLQEWNMLNKIVYIYVYAYIY